MTTPKNRAKYHRDGDYFFYCVKSRPIVLWPKRGSWINEGISHSCSLQTGSPSLLNVSCCLRDSSLSPYPPPYGPAADPQSPGRFHVASSKTMYSLLKWRHWGFNVFCRERIQPGDKKAMENLARYIVRLLFPRR